jgi:serine/threonine-protein phosphatase 2B regulatory subunit
MAIPQLLNNPLVERVVDIFDTDGNGQVDFKEYISALSIFTGKNVSCENTQKLDCKK